MKKVPDTDRLAAQPKTNQRLTVNPKDSAKASSDYAVAALHRDKSTASQTAGKLAASPIPDIRLAEQGDAFAQYRLGRFYAQHGGPHTPKSMSWYRKASNGLRLLAWAGNGEAMYVLGVMYAFGRGVTKDTEQARLWLVQAVERQVEAARPVLASLERHRNPQGERTGHGG
jgi:TPR repeat protein